MHGRALGNFRLAALWLLRCRTGQDQQRNQRPVSVHQLGLFCGSDVSYVPHQRNLWCPSEPSCDSELLCSGEDAIMDYSGGELTVFGQNETASIFATYPTEYLTLGRSFLDQVVGTGMLMLCILGLDEKRNTPAPSELVPAIVAAVVLGISVSMSANCGAAINPARDLGPRLFTFTAGWGSEVFTCYDYWFWVPIVAPLVGGVIGSFLYVGFIEWHLPDLEPTDNPQVLFTISDKLKQQDTSWEKEDKLKTAHL
ncbi:aquaporin-10a isoform 2-T2 [Menidia menidia]